jgi:hypothetical protein
LIVPVNRYRAGRVTLNIDHPKAMLGPIERQHHPGMVNLKAQQRHPEATVFEALAQIEHGCPLTASAC